MLLSQSMCQSALLMQARIVFHSPEGFGDMRIFPDVSNSYVRSVPSGPSNGEEGDGFGPRCVFQVIVDEENEEQVPDESQQDFESIVTTDTHIPFHGSSPQPHEQARSSSSGYDPQTRSGSKHSPGTTDPDALPTAEADVFGSDAIPRSMAILERLGTQLRGCRELAFIGRDSGRILCWIASEDLGDVEMRAREFASVYVAKSRVLEVLQPREFFQEMVLSTARDVLIIAALREPSAVLLFCNLYRALGNLSLAQFEMREVIDTMNIDPTRH